VLVTAVLIYMHLSDGIVFSTNLIKHFFADERTQRLMS
jgi:hypothetical protein